MFLNVLQMIKVAFFKSKISNFKNQRIQAMNFCCSLEISGYRCELYSNSEKGYLIFYPDKCDNFSIPIGLSYNKRMISFTKPLDEMCDTGSVLLEGALIDSLKANITFVERISRLSIEKLKLITININTKQLPEPTILEEDQFAAELLKSIEKGELVYSR